MKWCSGNTIFAAARKMTEIVWAVLTEKQDFDSKKDDGKIQTYESCGSGFGCQKLNNLKS